MAITEYNYIPTYTKLKINNKPKDVVTASYWNGLFNSLSNQGDHTAKELGNILNHFSTELAGIENEIAESAEDIANIRGVFRINVTYSNGVYTADKTFNEIKAAYDAGQYPYVVSGSNTIYTLTDCYLATEQMAMDFTRYLIGENTLETEKLRIYSYTTANGSNIERLDGEFNIPIEVLEVTLTTQNGVSTADKTFDQVKAAVESGTPVLKVHSDGAILWFFLLDKSPTEIDFVGLFDEQIIAYLTAKQDGTWETTVAARVTAEMLSSLNDKIGNIGQLTTTDKTNLVAAVNEVKQTTDAKQDKLIAGENITIAADGKTISATGGGSSYDDTELRQRIGDIEAKESTWDAKSNFSGSYNDLTDKPTIPAPVTEQTVSSWGFTKNTGTYSKPTDGIPKADLANDVQDSLSKAETALQSVSTDNIDALAVTNAKIANGAVSTGKIARGAVTKEKISTALLDKIDGMQPKTITDTAGYYTTDTVEGALAEIGGTLDGLEAAINTIRGIS